jgi:hypothetical protein
MEAIAMKMTQEEFDSIKMLLDIKQLDSFSSCPYLVNNFQGIFKTITNVSIYSKKDFNRKVYEYFDKDIFLKACDIEVDKVWNSSELQFMNIHGEWKDCNSDTKFRLKPQPDYSKEIESLQEKAKENGMKAIITFENI